MNKRKTSGQLRSIRDVRVGDLTSRGVVTDKVYVRGMWEFTFKKNGATEKKSYWDNQTIFRYEPTKFVPH